MSLDPRKIAEGYDRVAAAYAQKFDGELAHKPFDRVMLDWLVARTQGPICDLGCGPGHVAAYLRARGAEVTGIDISPHMVRAAGERHSDIAFRVADMRDLAGIPDRAFGGVAAFYSIIHQPHDKVPEALAAIRRVLKREGVLLLAFHVGEEIRHIDEFLGAEVDLDFVFFTVMQMKEWLAAAGFTLTESIEREAYPQEVATRRAYLWAKVS